MKFCPYCGTEIVDDASHFCIECGKAFPNKKDSVKSTNEEIITDENHNVEHEQETPISDEQLRAEYDENYDGYYDDLLPIDDGQVHFEIDRILLKKIGFLAGGALLVILLCLLMMYIF